VNLHRNRLTRNPWPRDHTASKPRGVDVLLFATVLVLAVRKSNGNHNLPVREKVGPPQAENIQPARTDPRPRKRSARGTCSLCVHYCLLSFAELDGWIEQNHMRRELETYPASQRLSGSIVVPTGRNTHGISRSAFLGSVRTPGRGNWHTGTVQKVEEIGV